MTELALILVIGFAAAGLAALLRAVAPVKWTTKKPLSCALCMSNHSVLALWLLVLATSPDFFELPPFASAVFIKGLLLQLGGIGVSMLVLTLGGAYPPPPPEL